MRNDVSLGAHLNVASENIAVALDNAEHDGLVIVPELVLAAEKTFVDLDRLARTADREITVNIAHVLADQIAHAPRGFVGHAKLALHFLGGHAVPGSREQEHHEKPVPQGRPGALKGRPSSWIDLIAAMLARKATALLYPVIGRLLLALEACQPLAEPDPHKVGKAVIIVREPLVKCLNRWAFNRHSRTPSENGYSVSRSVLTV